MRTVLLTTFILIAVCFTTNTYAQDEFGKRSEAVQAQIRSNAASGADEWNGLSAQYSFTFSEVLPGDQASAIDSKLVYLYPEIQSVKTTPFTQNTEMTIQVPLQTTQAEVKQMISRFGFNFVDIQKELVVTK